MFRKLTRLMRLSIMPLLMAACQPIPPFIATSEAAKEAPDGASFCLIAKPIWMSSTDNVETQIAVTKHNCKGTALCGWFGEEGKKFCAEFEKKINEPAA